jgi:hypothetical protein
MSKTVTRLEDELMQKHYEIGELRVQLTKCGESEKKMEKFLMKNKSLIDNQEELNQNNHEVPEAFYCLPFS